MIDLDIPHAELSKRIGCSQSYLTDILAGRRGGCKYIEPICRELKMSCSGTEKAARGREEQWRGATLA